MSDARLRLHHPRASRRAAAVRRVSCPWSLREALLFDEDAHVRAAAARRLGRLREGAAWLREAARDRRPRVRAAAYEALGRAVDDAALPLLLESVREDPAWWARRAAVNAAARAFGPRCVRVLDEALTDPFWRVRHAAVKRALALDPLVVKVLLAQPPRGHPHAAALEYLRRARDGHDAPTLLPEPPHLLAGTPLYDDDPAVMTARLASSTLPATQLALLLAEPHAPLRALALERLIEAPTRAALRVALVWLEDPRVPWAQSSAHRLLDGAGALAHELSRELLASASAHPRALSWALSWAARAGALDLAPLARARLTHDDERIRACAARACAALEGAPFAADARDAEGDPRLAPIEDPAAVLDAEDDPRRRRRAARALDAGELRALLLASRDADAGVRAIVGERLDAYPRAAVARLTKDRDPEVRAAALGQVGLELELAALEDALATERHPRVTELLLGLLATRGLIEEHPVHRPPAAHKDGPTRAPRRPLGRTGIETSPLIVSGAHELPLVALRRAARRGVNTFFWEPRYRSLGQFLKGKRELQVIAGSYEASPEAVRADLERALRRLDREVIDVFLLFWARSPARLSPEVHAALLEEKARGRVKAIGFSTHLRELAASALEAQPWDVVMTRHSAAHRGAEPLFAECAARGVGVLSFSALSYGRLVDDEVSAADCYRYSLAQPGVSATLTAPRYARELSENLGLFARPWLNEAARARVLEKGARVYKASKDLAALVRRTPTEISAERHDRLIERAEEVHR